MYFRKHTMKKLWTHTRRKFCAINRHTWIAYAGLILFYVFLESMGITCPILFLSGISCAGCGMSRAWLSLLRLDFASAFSYHPLFLLPVPAAFIYLMKKHIPKVVYQTVMVITVVLFMTVYIVRILSSDDSVVRFTPAAGLIGRAICFLGGLSLT